MRLLLSGLLVAAALNAQPYIFYRGIVNAASFRSPGLPGSGIARGSIFTIFGRGLGPAAGVAASFPLTTALGGTEVEVCAGNACVSALPLFAGSGQVNAIMPSNAPLGRASVRVRSANQSGNWSPVEVVASSVGIFAVNGAGFGPGVVQNFVSASEAPVNSLAATALPGQILVIYGTGLGAGLGPDREPSAGGPLPVNTEVFVGDRPARLLYAGRTPGLAGLDQFNLEVPPDTTAGCYLPVRVRTDGRTVSNSVTIAVHPRGERCSDPLNSLIEPLSRGGKVAALLAQRLETLADIDPDPPASYTVEWFFGALMQPQPSDFYFSVLSLPPVGSCNTVTVRGDVLDGPQLPPLLTGAGLDGGPGVRLSASGRSVTVPRTSALGVYGAQLTAALVSAAGFLFQSGSADVETEGGPDAGRIAGQFAVTPPLTWTNRQGLRIVNTTRPWTVNWSGARAGEDVVLVAGISGCQARRQRSVSLHSRAFRRNFHCASARSVPPAGNSDPPLAVERRGPVGRGPQLHCWLPVWTWRPEDLVPGWHRPSRFKEASVEPAGDRRPHGVPGPDWLQRTFKSDVPL
ncbi:MAG: hypothetical protein IPM24_12635 [Bryobacterales bacterium]|nr:hypothetical protein [Bryobacterales bacterium]